MTNSVSIYLRRNFECNVNDHGSTSDYRVLMLRVGESSLLDFWIKHTNEISYLGIKYVFTEIQSTHIPGTATFLKR